MSEDQRQSAHPGEPPKHGPAGEARWDAYLGWMREHIVDAVSSLPEHERRTSRVASGWTPLELLNHVLHMEQRWFVWGFLGEPVARPWGDWDVDDPTVVPEGAARWQVPDGIGLDELVQALRATGARTSTILHEHPLDAVGATGGRFSSDPPTLEWICFHVMADYQRHAGHLDIAVELAAALDADRPAT